MTLVDKVKQEFEKQGIEIISCKEYNEKFKVEIKDLETGIKIKWEIEKRLQWSYIKSFTDMTKKHLKDRYILEQMLK